MGDEERSEVATEKTQERVRRGRPKIDRLTAEQESVFGRKNDNANMWGLMRRERAKWFRLTWPDSAGVHVKEWPISVLSTDLIRERWGTGEYRVVWFKNDPDQRDSNLRHTHEGLGNIFELAPILPGEQRQESAPAAAPLPAMPGAALPAGFESALAIMNVIRNESTAQMAGMAQLAQVMMAGIRPERERTDPALLELLRSQGETLAAIQRSLSEPLEDEPSSAPVAAAAAAVATKAVPRFRPGTPMTETIKASVANYFAENPDKIVELVKVVPAVLDKLSQLTKPPAAPVPVARPRATVHAPELPAAPAPTPAAPPPPPKPKPAGPGLNALADSRPKTPPPVAANGATAAAE